MGRVAAVLLLLTAVGDVSCKDVSPAPAPPRIIRRNNLSCANKQYILDFHNKIRNHVASGRIDGQPKAANMEEMRWSESLANLAQKRADTCIFEHGDLELNGDRIGQNLAIVTSTIDNLRLNITQMIELWYNEVFQFGYKGGFDPNSGHYSQLIWGNTREVGCGFTYYEEEGWFKMYFVCDYYPPGNYIDQKPYDYGKFDCKKYGLMESRKYSKLCAIDNTETTVCKLEKPETSLNNVTANTTAVMNSEKLVESSNDTAMEEEITTTEISMTMAGLTELEENMEDVNGTGAYPLGEDGSEEELTSSSEVPATSTLDPNMAADRGANMAANLTMEAVLEETMEAVLNNTQTDKSNEVVPPEGSVILLVCKEAKPFKLDWKDKDEFFKAATQLLDLLINRKIYIATQELRV